jgi:hypothetical protein
MGTDEKQIFGLREGREGSEGFVNYPSPTSRSLRDNNFSCLKHLPEVWGCGIILLS